VTIAPLSPEPRLTEHCLTIAETDQGHRLDKLLAGKWPQFSRTSLKKACLEGRLTVDGLEAKASMETLAGQKVVLLQPEEPDPCAADPTVRLPVLYEDEHLVLINKPAGLVVHPYPGIQEPSAAGGILAAFPEMNGVGDPTRPGIVHRLDRDTTGIMALARTQEAWERLKQAFLEREVQKKYLAFTLGRPESEGLQEIIIGRHPYHKGRMAVRPKGRQARTSVKIKKYFPKTDISLVELTLLTGRTHQARIQLAELKSPVLADRRYGRSPDGLLKLFPSLAPFLKRQLLHARRLNLPHPSGGRLARRAPWPEDFAGLWQELNRLEKENPDPAGG
jgi:23S rRNA pseudouridine1911/1915/1917 synthase